MKRNVLLFGAGAMMGWCGPSTHKLTGITRKSGFLTTDNETTITEFIYQQLIKAGHPSADVNFETIINVIEELITHFSLFQSPFEDGKALSISESFLASRFDDIIFNFSVENHPNGQGYDLKLPNGKSINPNFRPHYNERPKQFFLRYLLTVIISDIIQEVAKYAQHTESKTKVLTEQNSEINLSFSNWIKKLSRNGILRMYSLNYDRNFKIILEHHGLPIFEGFGYGSQQPNGEGTLADIPKILTDVDSHTHYNLHGSIYWNVRPFDGNDLPNPQYLLTKYPVIPVLYNDSAIWQSEKGKTMILMNIITGHQKSQASILPPFKQMQSALDKDCCMADRIFIVGYSFNDAHINESIKLAILYNPKAKFIIVNRDFTHNELDHIVSMKIFSAAGPMAEMLPTSVSSDLHRFFNERFEVHACTFEDFLQKETRLGRINLP